MTAPSQKRVPILLGPNWQGVPLSRGTSPQAPSNQVPSRQAPSFHASLRACAGELEQRPETEPVNPAAIQQLASEPPQLHLTLLKQIASWLSAKTDHAANNKLQVAQPAALDKKSFSPPVSSRPQFGVLGQIWSWLHAKYLTSNTKRLRVAEMVPLGEKRFLAVVCMEGREFLIGGGASGVSVVTQLDAVRDSAIAPHREFELQGAIE